LIVASFAKQYGIRLEKEDLSYREYIRLLSGIMYETPLGEVVRIRSETDMKTIREMTAHEKRIRSEWQAFKNKKRAKESSRLEEDGMKAFAAFAKSFWG